MTALPFNATREACHATQRYMAARRCDVPALCLALGLSAINEGVKAIRSGKTDAGIRLVEHGEQYLAAFLPKMDARVATEIGIAGVNLRRKAMAP